MIPVPEELTVVRAILTAWRRGASYRSIAAQLAADGVPTKQGGRWHHQTVAKVMERREYYMAALSEV